MVLCSRESTSQIGQREQKICSVQMMLDGLNDRRTDLSLKDTRRAGIINGCIKVVYSHLIVLLLPIKVFFFFTFFTSFLCTFTSLFNCSICVRDYTVLVVQVLYLVFLVSAEICDAVFLE